ncbi:hypothetical protein [Streptosporangium saharense]|uniref:hypothetical protein n=1 Tax=Streptosporangium saharense TaxID=1706840 RepID=UPI00342D31B8
MRLRKTLLSLSALAALAPALTLGSPARASAPAGSAALLPKLACAGEVCVEFSGDRNGFRAMAQGFGFFGHVDLWGPGVSFRHSPDMQDPTTSANGLGSGWLCAHGWKHENGNFVDMGFPCVEVPS